MECAQAAQIQRARGGAGSSLTVEARLVAIDVPRGSGYDNQSGLNNLYPQVYGRLADDGCGKRVAFVVIHPSSNFMSHYLLGPMQRRGRAILGLNTRYAGNDSTLIMERAIQDLGAGVGHLRKLGYERVMLLGNSGGGSLAAFYQAEAEKISVTTTPDGMPFDLRPEQLPPVDGLAMLAAHPGRALTMVEWIDPAVVDERDMYATDAALDMYNPANGPPYDRAWLQRYRAAQRARNDRITDWVLGRLAALEANADSELIKDEPFIVYRTAADPRFMDITIDPSDRAVSNTRRSNYGPTNLGRFSTLRSFLSQWSARLSRADGPTCMARTSVPVLNVLYSADTLVFPAQVRLWSQVAGERCRDHVLKGATHHLVGQEKLIEELADLLVAWADRL
jgi:pimeloyl-ACP methyl ester carboxylesterase